MSRCYGTAYELELAPNMRMRDVFHVSLLKKWNSEKHGVIPIPPTLTPGEHEEFEVQKVIGERVKHVQSAVRGRGRPKLRREYLVSWRGQDSSCNTWEPEKDMKNTQDKVDGHPSAWS